MTTIFNNNNENDNPTPFTEENEREQEVLGEALRRAGYEGSVDEMLQDYEKDVKEREESQRQAQASQEKQEETLRKLFRSKAEKHIEDLRQAQNQVRTYYQQQEEQTQQVRAMLPEQPENKLYWNWWKKRNPTLANHPEVKARIKEHKKSLGVMFHDESKNAQRKLKERTKGQ